MMEECLTIRSVHTKRDFVQKPLSEAEVGLEGWREREGGRGGRKGGREGVERGRDGGGRERES